MNKLYLAGPMRGKPNHNREEFFAKAQKLSDAGHWVVNPAALDADREPRSWFDAMRRDIKCLVDCDGLAYLDGWANSDGASIEVDLASDLGLNVAHWKEWLPQSDLPPIVGFAGYGQTGKDTAAGIVAANYDFEHRSFADPMKRVALKLLRVSNPDVAYVIERRGWEYAKRNIDWLRGYLQTLGTDAMRAEDEAVWVRMALDQPTDNEGIVVSDVRFPNEMRAIQERGGKVYRIHRPGYGPANSHESEVALDGHAFEIDGHIQNNGRPEGFREEIFGLFENEYAYPDSCSDHYEHNLGREHGQPVCACESKSEFTQYPNARTLSFDEVRQ